jgi:hypothetical protein
MENKSKISSIENDLTIRVKAKKCPRYKAEPELAEKIQSVDVEVNEDYSGDSEIFELNIYIKNKRMINADA